MQCPNCGAAVKQGSRFCAECGTTMPAAPSVGDDRTLVVPPSNYVAPQSQPAYGQSPQARPQPQFNQPPQYAGGQSPQHQPPQNQPPQYSQPAYGQSPQAGPPQGYAPPPPNYTGYAMPGAPAVTPNAGRTPALLMLVSALTMVVAMFLPYLQDFLNQLSLVRIMQEILSNTSEVDGDVWIFVALVVSIIVSFVFSLLALLKRRNIWGVLALILGILLFGFNGLLLIGANSSSTSAEAGIAIWIILIASAILSVASIVFMTRKKA